MMKTDNSSTPNLDTSEHDIDYGDARMFTIVIYSGICQIIDIFGVITNIISIVCFIKQGFKEPINISLLGLAISDMCSLITLIVINTFFTLMFTTTNLPFDPLGVLLLVAGYPHVVFTRISCWITALITLERCLCIVAPLKVKNMVTSRRVCIIIVSVYIILIFSETPMYTVVRLDMVFVPERNITLLGIVSSEDRDNVEMLSFMIDNFIIPISACLVIIICTIILVISLSKTSEWRKTSMKLDIFNRNQRVAKMVTMISALFISCFVPDVIIMLLLAFVPDLKVGGRSFSISIIAGGVGLILESINSSVNIFIYYHMSSIYRNTFKTIFFQGHNNRKERHEDAYEIAQ